MDNAAVTVLLKERDVYSIRRSVLKALLSYAGDGRVARPRLTQRAIAEMIGADVITVAISLRSLEDEGITRREHLRIIIDRGSLQEIAG